MGKAEAKSESYISLAGLTKLNFLKNKFNVSFGARFGRQFDGGNRTTIYSEKKECKERILYRTEHQNNIIGQMQLVNKIREGIEKDEFSLYFQPEYNLISNEIIGAEALVRWPQPISGFISPEIFIPVAEKSNQIFKLERWIIDKALQQKEQWECNGLNHIELSINISSKTLENESGFQEIEKIISSYQVDYSKIVFEITETVIISHVESVIERLNRLRSHGIKIALDDFGTGFSSFSHIMNLPIDIIKIDRSFIKSLPDGKEGSIITRNILSLARDLKYRVVAEGIETQEQLELLKTLSCEQGQGFLLCKPLPSDKINDILRQ